MKDIIEPLSKCGLFAAIRETTARMFYAETNLQVAEGLGDEGLILAACADFDAARRDLTANLVAAEDSGLLDELAGYLATTYGG